MWIMLDHVSRPVELIAKLKCFVPMHTLLIICRSLMVPCITYGLVAWGQASRSSIDKLLKLQKRVLRFIYSSDHNEHAIPLFPDANILLLIFSYYESIINLMLKSDMEFRQKVSRLYLSMSSVFIASKLIVSCSLTIST